MGLFDGFSAYRVLKQSNEIAAALYRSNDAQIRVFFKHLELAYSDISNTFIPPIDSKLLKRIVSSERMLANRYGQADFLRAMSHGFYSTFFEAAALKGQADADQAKRILDAILVESGVPVLIKLAGGTTATPTGGATTQKRGEPQPTDSFENRVMTFFQDVTTNPPPPVRPLLIVDSLAITLRLRETTHPGTIAGAVGGAVGSIKAVTHVRKKEISFFSLNELIDSRNKSNQIIAEELYSGRPDYMQIGASLLFSYYCFFHEFPWRNEYYSELSDAREAIEQMDILFTEHRRRTSAGI